MFIPGSTLTNTNLSIAASVMNNNFHQQNPQQQQQQQQQQSFFDNLKDSRSNKFSSTMSRKAAVNPNFSLDPDLLRELNARYLHDISATRSTNGTNPNLDSNAFPTLLFPPFLRAEHYHQHNHTHEHNLNIFTPPSNLSFPTNLNNALIDKLSKSDNSLSSALRTAAVNNFSSSSLLPQPGIPLMFPPFNMINSQLSSTTTSTSTLTTASTTTTTITTTPPITTTTTTATVTPLSHSSISWTNGNLNSVKRGPSPQAKKSNKWCAAHVRISWMIYQQQQRSKDKLSSTDSKKDDDEEQKQQQQSSSSLLNNKLSDSVSVSKPSSLPSLTSSSSASDLSISLPTTYQTAILPPAPFNFRSPFEMSGVPNGSFGRLLPSSSTAFGGLGSLFPPPSHPPAPTAPPSLPSLPSLPVPPSTSTTIVDRKQDINGSMPSNPTLNLDWLRQHHRSSMPTPFIAPLPIVSNTSHENGSLKKHEESQNSNREKKRSLSTVNNNDDDRRLPQHHMMHSQTHLSNLNNSSTNRCRSRSPNRSSHHSTNHSSTNHHQKVSSTTPPPSLSSSSLSGQRKRTSPSMKSTCSDSLKLSHSTSSLPSLTPSVNFPGFDPLSLSIFDRQRLSAGCASLFGVPPGATNHFFPPNFDATSLRSNSSSGLFHVNDNSSAAIAAALMQREHFLNSIRFSHQQEQILERERAAAALAALNGSISSINKTQKPNVMKTEQNSPKTTEDSTRISPKVLTSPGSHSSSSSSSRSSSSKKSSHVKRVKQSNSPTSSIPISNEKQDNHIKQETTQPISITS